MEQDSDKGMLDVKNETTTEVVEEDIEKEDDDNPKAVNIDLSWMKSKYQFRNKPTLANLLTTEYGMEDNSTPVHKKKDTGKGKPQKKKKKTGFGDDTGKDMERERQQDERHLQIVEDMKKLRDFYYQEYSHLLQDKVEQQRQDIRKRSQATHNKMREGSHKVKKRLEHHHKTSDSSFLQDIPKTDLYHIVQLQDKLVKDGTLKSHSDLERFWDRIQQPDIFFMYFNTPKSDAGWKITPKDFGIKELKFLRDMSRNNDINLNENAPINAPPKIKVLPNNVRSTSPRGDKDQGKAKTLTRITETRESSRPNTRSDQWAITQQFPAQNRVKEDRRKSSFTGLTRPQVSQTQNKLNFQLELEKRFPKLEMPKLHCFTMSLGPKPPDPEEVRHEIRLHQLEKNRKSYTHRLTKMHQLAMANAAASSRILETHEDIDFIINGSPLQDLISDQHFYSGLPEKKAEQRGDTEPPTFITEGRKHEHTSTKRSKVSSSTKNSVQVSASSKQYSRKIKRHGQSEDDDLEDMNAPLEALKPQPLNMAEMKAKARTMSAKCLSSFWTNYTNQGTGVYFNEPYKV